MIRLKEYYITAYAPEFVPIFYYRDKTPVHMFYFLNQHFENLENQRTMVR